MEKRQNIENMYPLAPMQQGLLFHTLLAPETEVYMPQISLTLEGELDSAGLQHAWRQTMARHTVLRTSFYWEEHEDPFQVVWRQVDLPWIERDWRTIADAEEQARLQTFTADDRAAGFAFNTPPLMRLALLRTRDNRYQLIWSYHHLILDGWSAGIILRDVFNHYAAQRGKAGAHQPNATPPVRPYGDYIAWLRQQDMAAAKAFWQDHLQGVTEGTDLTITTSGHATEAEWGEQQLVFAADDMAALRAFAQPHQLTLNTCVQGAFGLLLSRYCDRLDVVFGATTSGRPPALTGVETMAGMFINTLPVRIRVDANAEVTAWLQQLQAERASALAYEYAALMSIQEWSDLPPGEPLFKNLLVFENYPVEASQLPSFANLELKAVSVAEWTHFPLTLQVSAGDVLTLTAKYNRAQIEPSAIDRLLRHLQTILTGMAARPQGRLRDISLLTAAEQQQLAQWNQTARSYPLDRPLTDGFEAQVEKTPSAVAVIAEDQCLTYRELNARANRLAYTLQALGVGPEVLVALYLPRSLEMVTAILAILKAGGVYVPLDPDYPVERLGYMLEDSQATALITDEFTGHTLPSLPPGLQVVHVEPGLADTCHPTTDNPVRDVTPDHSIYVIYTSGSTGRPKGVVNTHRGLVNRMQWMQDTYHLKVGDRVLHKTPLSFDVSAWEVFWPLLNGATMVLCAPGAHGDSAYLADLIIRHQVDTLHFVPAMLDAFLDDPRAAECHSLKRVICSGEALSPGLQQRFFETLSTATLHNLYGPTEAAIDVTAWVCQANPDDALAPVPIGHPIANTQIYLLDSQGDPVPVGIPGELHIGGVGLARGYLYRPDLTAEAFVPNPQGASDISPILYKTGDLARYRPDGAIEFLGRLDHQVKLRGFRIELGEIETLLARQDGVRQATVIRREDRPGNPQLVAYVVPSKGSELSDAEWDTLRQALQRHLPDYMIPSAMVSVPELPLTPNGKINRRALPAPDGPSGLTETFEAPRNPTETQLADLWCETLQVDRIGIHDNFFTLGGNSLIATRLTSRLRAAFHLDLPLRALFERPTIMELAARIEALQMALPSATSQAASTGRKEMTL